MRALVKPQSGPWPLEIRDIPTPGPRPNEVLIAPVEVGICGTDLQIQRGSFPVRAPVVIGHEVVGIVAAPAKATAGLVQGTPVVVEPHAGACGLCDACLAGNRHVCPDKRGLGWGSDGAAAELMVAETALVHTLPHSVLLGGAVLIEPLAVAVSALRGRQALDAGASVAVVGNGPVGLLAALFAQSLGCVVEVHVRDLRSPRSKIAERLGLNVVIAGGDRRFDRTVEAAGNADALEYAIRHTRPLGVVTVIGNHPSAAELPIDEAAANALILEFSRSSRPSAWDEAISLIATRKIDPTPMVTHRYRLSEWASAFAAVESRRATKAVLLPQER